MKESLAVVACEVLDEVTTAKGIHFKICNLRTEPKERLQVGSEKKCGSWWVDSKIRGRGVQGRRGPGEKLKEDCTPGANAAQDPWALTLGSLGEN